METVAILNVVQNKGAARIWMQGNTLRRAGFEPRTNYEVRNKEGAIVCVKTDIGVKLRQVSSRVRNEKETPIIDLNNAAISAMLEGFTRVKAVFREGEIYIVPLASEIRAKERLDDARRTMAAGRPLTFGSLAHGGGILSHALETGFTLEKVASALKFANEYRDDLIHHALAHNPIWNKDTIALQGPMQELCSDLYVQRIIGRVHVLEAGLPCSGASLAGRAKRGLKHPEAHPEVGHLVYAFLRFIEVINPCVILLENVVQYLNTASMDIIRNHLRDNCYEVYETQVSGADFNCLEDRHRMCMVAVTRGMPSAPSVPFSFSDLVFPEKVERTLGDIMEPIALDDPRWSPMAGLKDKQTRDAENGNNFKMQVFTARHTSVANHTKGMAKNRSTDPKYQHPENPELLRVPTPIEHARVKDIPEALIEGLCTSTAHELLGQSICYPPFVAIGRLIARWFIALRDLEETEMSICADLLAEAVIAKAKREARQAELQK